MKFKTPLAEDVFHRKYAQGPNDSWQALATRLVEDVCGTRFGTDRALMSKEDRASLVDKISNMKFIPGGRYLYYAGRPKKFFNNCFIGIAREDTREEWAHLMWWATRCLMVGGGIGIDYSILRESGAPLSSTGGVASGPIPLMLAVNEIGRNVMQGGSRRSAIYASLNWKHPDIETFLHAKDWHTMEIVPGISKWDAKNHNFNYNAPLDMTNISINYDNESVNAYLHKDSISTRWHVDGAALVKNRIFIENCRQALKTGEPGFSFNFRDKEIETGRNACTEVTSSDHSDVCNLGSINLGAIESIEEFKEVVSLGTMFLLCGTLRADLPTEETYKVREKNRRLGLGLMGVHEWMLKRGLKYEMSPELRKWLSVYRDVSDRVAKEHADRLFISHPVAVRAIAPTGSISILASTTSGIEPLYAVAYKRRYLTDGTRWKYQFVIDATAKHIIEQYGVNPDDIETATDLAADWERRIKFQADVQDYVDMAISSTINLPPWGSPGNNEDLVMDFARTLAKYAPRLRGFTCYPDGSRGGQPITKVSYQEAIKHHGVIFEENDICDITGKGGVCGS